MKNKKRKREKTYDIDRRSERIKMYKRTARRHLRARRTRAVLVMGTLIAMLAPLALSALGSRLIKSIFELIPIDRDIAELLTLPSLVLIETLVLVFALSPLVYGLKAYAARAAEGEDPTSEIIVGFYSNPTYRGYSRKRAVGHLIRLLALCFAVSVACTVVSFLGERLVDDGETARAAILYFGSLLAMSALAFMAVASGFNRYLQTTLFLRSPGIKGKGLRRKSAALNRRRPEIPSEALALNASFIGWFAVVLLTAGLAALYVVPYLTLSNATCRAYLCRGMDA